MANVTTYNNISLFCRSASLAFSFECEVSILSSPQGRDQIPETKNAVQLKIRPNRFINCIRPFLHSLAARIQAKWLPSGDILRIGLAFKACLEPLFSFPHFQFFFPHFFFCNFQRNTPTLTAIMQRKPWEVLSTTKVPFLKLKKLSYKLLSTKQKPCTICRLGKKFIPLK